LEVFPDAREIDERRDAVRGEVLPRANTREQQELRAVEHSTAQDDLAPHAHGARLILTYQGERVEDSVRKTAAELGGGPVFPCDVTNDDSLDALAAAVGRIDGIVHSIAFVKKEDLSGKVYDTSRDGFAMAMDISSYSLIALVGHLKDNLNDGGSIMALTYLGGTQIVPNYNVAGIAKRRSNRSSAIWPTIWANAASALTRSRPARSRRRPRAKSRASPPCRPK